jgi:hypothetical protein
MKFGIDFDCCYRADPEAVGELVDVLHKHGHECYLITKRSDEDEWAVEEVKKTVDGQMPLIFCGDKYKDDVAQSYDLDIDVWLDDHPEFIRSPSRLKEMLMEAKDKLFRLRHHLKQLLLSLK